MGILSADFLKITLAITRGNGYNGNRKNMGVNGVKRKHIFHNLTIPIPKENDFSSPMEIRSIIGNTSAEKLEKEIKETSSFSKFWERHKKQIISKPVSDYLRELLNQKGMKRADVVVQTGLDKAYVYQIFAGKKKPSRDKLITIAFGMKLREEETQTMLRLAGYRELWAKDERDALLLFGIQKKMSLEKNHSEMERCGLDPLVSSVK